MTGNRSNRRRDKKDCGDECAAFTPESYRLLFLLTFETFDPRRLTDAHRDEIATALAALGDDAADVLRALAKLTGPSVGQAMLTADGRRALAADGYDVERLSLEADRIGGELLNAGTLPKPS